MWNSGERWNSQLFGVELRGFRCGTVGKGGTESFSVLN